MSACIQCRVRGRVQGVFYRAGTQDKARELALAGWVRNMPDGSVEVLACGDEQSLRQLQAWLQQGPAGARVDDVACSPVTAGNMTGFSVRY
jgi:acylphosphatase